jgi:hypothetical protein
MKNHQQRPVNVSIVPLVPMNAEPNLKDKSERKGKEEEEEEEEEEVIE